MTDRTQAPLSEILIFNSVLPEQSGQVHSLTSGSLTSPVSASGSVTAASLPSIPQSAITEILSPQDSARSDSARSDSARSDSVRSDSVRSDSVRSDSLNLDLVTLGLGIPDSTLSTDVDPLQTTQNSIIQDTTTRSIPIVNSAQGPDPGSEWWLEQLEAGLEAAVQALDQGQALCEQAQWQKAIALCARVLQVFEPAVAIAYRTSGWALEAQGNWAEAEECYQRSLQVQPGYAEVHVRLGQLYGSQARWQAAIAAYHDAIALDPSLVEVYWQLGQAWQQVGNHAQAQLNFERATQLSALLNPAMK